MSEAPPHAAPAPRDGVAAGDSRSAPALDVAAVVKHFGLVRALRGVTFSVLPGEIFGYLGPNGAGKTTTLRVAVGLVRADRGAVRILGGDGRRAPVRERIGFLPGDLRLDGQMTGHAVLDHFARFRASRPPVLRPALLDALKLESHDLSRRIKFLSHGTRQKIGLVVAMQHDPDVLLLDEPTLGLDPLVQRAFRDFLIERARLGRAVLFSSHVLSEVEAICHRVAVLRDGQILAVEPIQDLRGRMLRRAQIRFHDGPPADIGAVPGVEHAEIDGRNAVLHVRGDVNPLLRRLAACEIEHFVFPEPQLEDIFLGYYERGSGGDA